MFITKAELARRLRKTTRTVEIWMAKNYLPFLRIGRSVLFYWPAVQAHLHRQFGSGPSE